MAVARAAAKASKRGKTVQPTVEMPWTNANVTNRVARNCKPEQIKHWLDTPCWAPSQVPGSKPVAFGSAEHWGEGPATGCPPCTREKWLLIDEVEANSAEWQDAVDRRSIQPAELQAPFPRRQLRARPLPPSPRPRRPLPPPLCRCVLPTEGRRPHSGPDAACVAHRRRVWCAPTRGTST